MADRRRGKQRKREEQPDKPTKEEYAVAKFLRFNLPTREGKLVGMSVQCFIASKAVDLLIESKWGNKAKKDAALFTTRAGCVDYCNNLLMKGLFHRAARVGRKKEKDRDAARKKKKLKEGEEDVKEIKEEKPKPEKKSKKKEKKKEKEDDEDTEKDKEKESEEEKKTEEKKDDEKKKKRKLRLEMHELQIFKDGDEIYVWIYDPVPFKTFMIGLLLVFGAIAVCMFPLWPLEVRHGIYYLSLAAAGFVGVILALCVVRLVLFCMIWGLTFGRHHFWFLPNLTEDVGFFDSFRPLYKHEYFGPSEAKSGEKEPLKDSAEEEEKKDEKTDEEEEEKEGEQEEEERGSEKEGSLEGSEDNGYEIVEREDLIENEDERGEEDEESEHEEESKKTK